MTNDRCTHTEQDLESLRRELRRVAFEEQEPPLPIEAMLHTAEEIAIAVLRETTDYLGLNGNILAAVAELTGGSAVDWYKMVYWLLLYALEHRDEADDVRRAMLERINCGGEYGKLRAELFEREARLALRQWREENRVEFVAGT